MKSQTLIYFLFIILICTAACKKHKTNKPVDKLPPGTQTGANTLGFLLNGEAWSPHGFNGTANLSIDVDFGFNDGVFGIAAYRTTSGEHIGFGIKDSLAFIKIPITLNLNKTSLYQFGISTNYCSIDYYDSTVYRSGSLTITKLDKSDRIISGTFSAILYKKDCDTLKITDGRFDMKF